MTLGVWGMFFLKMIILFVGIYVIVILTPKFAAFIDKRRKDKDMPEAPRPERVEDDDNSENNADGGENDISDNN